MRLLHALIRAQDVALCVARKWWRPISCMGVALAVLNIAVTILVSGIILPLTTGKPMDFAGLGTLTGSLAALVASLTPFVVARSWEKTKGVDGA